MTDWISCEEGLPEDGVEVIVWVESNHGSFVTMSRIFIDFRKVRAWTYYEDEGESITHWTPTPEPPEKK